MEHLTKQQIVLLTLLVSFVTSIATGIVTVSLMDQAPQGVSQTINQVIERTIERVVTASPAPVANVNAIATFESQIAQSSARVSKSIVRLKPSGGGVDSVTGFGIVLSEAGLIVADKASLTLSSGASLGSGIVAVIPSGEEYNIHVVQSEIEGDLAFVAVLMPPEVRLSPVIAASSTTSMKLGDSVFALAGKGTPVLEEGFLKKVPERASDSLETSIPGEKVLLGTPLFNVRGEVLGIKTKSLESSSVFHSLEAILPVAPVLRR